MRDSKVEALLAEQNPGRCCVCDKPLAGLTKGNKPRTRLCDNLDCTDVFNLAHSADSHARKRAGRQIIRICDTCGHSLGVDATRRKRHLECRKIHLRKRYPGTGPVPPPARGGWR